MRVLLVYFLSSLGVCGENIETNFIFLVRLLLSLRWNSKIFVLTMKNILASLIFLVRLYVSLHIIIGNIYEQERNAALD